MKLVVYLLNSFMYLCYHYFDSVVVAVGLYGNDDMHNAIVQFSDNLHSIQQDIDVVSNEVWLLSFCKFLSLFSKVSSFETESFSDRHPGVTEPTTDRLPDWCS